MSEFVSPIEHDGHDLREKAVAARDAVADLAAEAKEYAAERATMAKEKAAQKLKQSREQVVDFIQKNPFKTIAIAAGIGMLAGILLKRR